MDKHLEWLVKSKDYVEINAIEKDLQMPEGTLKKFVDGKRGLADQWHELVINWVKEFKK